MKKSRKILSVVLAVIMLATCFSMMASAYTYVPSLTSGDIKFITEADKTTVEPGDVVTFSLKIDTARLPLAGFNAVVVFNGDQLSPVGSTVTEWRTWQGDCAASFANPNASGNMNFPVAQLANYFTEEEKAYFTKACMMAGTALSSTYRWNPESRETYATFQMTVSENVQPGEEIWIGTHDATYLRGAAAINVDTKRQPTSAYDLTESMVKLTVASAEEGPVVAKSRSQVKMTATSDTTVADAFTFRVISTITDADWDAYFANTAAGGDTSAIQRLGFVAYKGTEGFDMETAKAVAQGTPTEGYDVAWTDYVQKADDSSDAYFGARLEITSAETRSDVTYVGVVEYLNADGTTAYAFYDAAEQALLNTNYDTIVEDYLATYPYEA